MLRIDGEIIPQFWRESDEWRRQHLLTVSDEDWKISVLHGIEILGDTLKTVQKIIRSCTEAKTLKRVQKRRQFCTGTTNFFHGNLPLRTLMWSADLSSVFYGSSSVLMGFYFLFQAHSQFYTYIFRFNTLTTKHINSNLLKLHCSRVGVMFTHVQFTTTHLVQLQPHWACLLS